MIAHPKIMIIFFIFVGGVQHKKKTFLKKYCHHVERVSIFIALAE